MVCILYMDAPTTMSVYILKCTKICSSTYETMDNKFIMIICTIYTAYILYNTPLNYVCRPFVYFTNAFLIVVRNINRAFVYYKVHELNLRF